MNKPKEIATLIYSHSLIFKTKTIFRKIKLIFGLKIDFENWKWPIFECPQSGCLARYQKNPLRKVIWMQKSIKFHLPYSFI